jgi:hypothetical protein
MSTVQICMRGAFSLVPITGFTFKCCLTVLKKILIVFYVIMVEKVICTFKI